MTAGWEGNGSGGELLVQGEETPSERERLTVGLCSVG